MRGPRFQLSALVILALVAAQLLWPEHCGWDAAVAVLPSPPRSAVTAEPSRSGRPVRLEVMATACTVCDPGMDGRGITRSGAPARPWRTLAVDPAVVPLGSRVYIPALAHTPSGGWFVAEDTGGAIRGYAVDIYMPDRRTALEFGRKHLEVYVYFNDVTTRRVGCEACLR